MNKFLLITFVVLFIFCSPHRPRPVSDAAIPVAGERLSLSPLISEASLEDMPEWPADPVQQKVLLEKFNEIWKKLLSEFKRCEKYGLYTMVDDKDAPTVRISIVITSARLENDTLYMPVRLQAERLSDDKRYIYTLPVFATLTSKNKTKQPFHYYGHLLSDYSRNFPYTILVSFFYQH